MRQSSRDASEIASRRYIGRAVHPAEHVVNAVQLALAAHAESTLFVVAVKHGSVCETAFTQSMHAVEPVMAAWFEQRSIGSEHAA
jgi:hypothetical protein